MPERPWHESVLAALAAQLPRVLTARRWYAGKGQAIQRVTVRDWALLVEDPATLLAVVTVETDRAPNATYFVPVVVRKSDAPGSALDPFGQVGDDVLDDAVGDVATCRALLRGIVSGRTLETARGGHFQFRSVAPTPSDSAILDDLHPESAPIRVVGVEQSNSSVIFGDRAIFKTFRRLSFGINPELEILHFLRTCARFDRVPALLGWAEYVPPDGAAAPVGVLQRFVPNSGDGWAWALRTLTREPAALVQPIHDLGRVLGELHRSLASDPTSAAFAPEAISTAGLDAWLIQAEASLDDALARIDRLLAADGTDQPGAAERRQDAAAVLAGADRLRSTLRGVLALADGNCVRTRHHGDFHLGQTLVTDHGWTIIDFEGEPLRSLDERRAKQTPLRDVAGLLRSLDYARATATQLAETAARDETSRPSIAGVRQAVDDARTAFLASYADAVVGASILPPAVEPRRRSLAALELEKALYEVHYELGNRPDWVAIPLQALARLARAD